MDLGNKRKLKILGCYVLSILLLLLYYRLDHSEGLHEFLIKADNYKPDSGFGFYAIIGMIKYGSLVAGIIMPVVLTIMLLIRIKK